jgi:DNA-binding HxlR family transcriptional regulator
MREKTPDLRRSACPVNAALEILGDTWSLLIVRDMMFLGRSTYNEFLNAGEKIATNILSDRLQKLEYAKIIEKRRDPDDARKFIYRLTEKGIDLAPMLVEMILWSNRHAETTAPPGAIKAMKKDREAFLAAVRKNWAQLSQT